MIEGDAAAFLGQDLSSPCQSSVRHAEGIWIEDHPGHRFMDFHGNSAHHLGYAHPRVLAAIRDQLDRLTFAPRRFACDPVWRNRATGPLPTGAEHVPQYDCGACPCNHPSDRGRPMLDRCGRVCARAITDILRREGDIAAVVAEPMRSIPLIPPPGFWAEVRAACDEPGTLLIFDGIPTGLGKTGRMLATEHEGVVPDILVLGKALGGAVLPIAALIARPGLDVAAPWSVGHYTHEKNSVTTRAALEVLDVIADEGLADRAQDLGAFALERLEDMAATTPVLRLPRGRGVLLGVEVADPATGAPDPGGLSGGMAELQAVGGRNDHPVAAPGHRGRRSGPGAVDSCAGRGGGLTPRAVRAVRPGPARPRSRPARHPGRRPSR